MQICKEHMERLRKAVEDKGVGHLISDEFDVILNRIREEFLGNPPRDSYDPLTHAIYTLMSNALLYGGGYLLMQQPDGSYLCPCCEVNHHIPEGIEGNSADEWFISNASEDGYRGAEKNGLVPKKKKEKK